jgi:hypothetical protein
MIWRGFRVRARRTKPAVAGRASQTAISQNYLFQDVEMLGAYLGERTASKRYLRILVSALYNVNSLTQLAAHKRTFWTGEWRMANAARASGDNPVSSQVGLSLRRVE